MAFIVGPILRSTITTAACTFARPAAMSEGEPLTGSGRFYDINCLWERLVSDCMTQIIEERALSQFA